MSVELLEFLHLFNNFVYFILQIFFRKFLEHFSLSGFLLTVTQVFTPFDCLHSSWCNLSWKFSVIGLNSSLKFSGKFLSCYLGPFSCKVQILEKGGACLFYLVQDFVFSNESLVEQGFIQAVLLVSAFERRFSFQIDLQLKWGCSRLIGKS